MCVYHFGFSFICYSSIATSCTITAVGTNIPYLVCPDSFIYQWYIILIYPRNPSYHSFRIIRIPNHHSNSRAFKCLAFLWCMFSVTFTFPVIFHLLQSSLSLQSLQSFFCNEYEHPSALILKEKFWSKAISRYAL